MQQAWRGRGGRGTGWQLVGGLVVGIALALPLAGLAGVEAVFDPAQEHTWAMPLPDLYDVDAEGDSVWAVGYWGMVLHSTDGGETWSYRPTPTAEILFAVSFADAQHGWAVGNHGAILRSRDGGLTWERQVAMVPDEMEGTRALDSALFGVSAISPQEAWIVGDFGVVLHTTDGETWQSVPLDPAVFADDNVPDRILNAVYFATPTHGWIAGEFGTTLRTTDGGATWTGTRTIEGAIPDIYLFDLSGDAAGGVLAGGVGGVLLASTDGGATWNALEAPTTAGLFGVAWEGARGIAVGDRGVIVRSDDGGRTWTDPNRPRLFNWLRGATLANGRAFAVGERGLVLRSRDGGATWEQSSGATPPPSSGISVPEPGSSQTPGRGESGQAEPEPRAP